MNYQLKVYIFGLNYGMSIEKIKAHIASFKEHPIELPPIDHFTKTQWDGVPYVRLERLDKFAVDFQQSLIRNPPKPKPIGISLDLNFGVPPWIDAIEKLKNQMGEMKLIMSMDSARRSSESHIHMIMKSAFGTNYVVKQINNYIPPDPHEEFLANLKALANSFKPSPLMELDLGIPDKLSRLGYNTKPELYSKIKIDPKLTQGLIESLNQVGRAGAKAGEAFRKVVLDNDSVLKWFGVNGIPTHPIILKTRNKRILKTLKKLKDGSSPK